MGNIIDPSEPPRMTVDQAMEIACAESWHGDSRYIMHKLATACHRLADEVNRLKEITGTCEAIARGAQGTAADCERVARLYDERAADEFKHVAERLDRLVELLSEGISS